MIRNSLESKYTADTVALILRMEQRKMEEAAKRAFELAENGRATIYIPAFTLAEILYLSQKKRIETTLSQVTGYISHFPNLVEHPLDRTIIKVASEITDIPELHDRLIAATARYFNTPLITNDGTLRKSIFVETIWD